MALVLKDECYAIVGACFEVYKEMGCGFLESVYEECLAIEFELQRIPFWQQMELPLAYKQRRLTKIFQPDFVCFEAVVVEIKAASTLTDMHPCPSPQLPESDRLPLRHPRQLQQPPPIQMGKNRSLAGTGASAKL
jgi:GxxExxY protein